MVMLNKQDKTIPFGWVGGWGKHELGDLHDLWHINFICSLQLWTHEISSTNFEGTECSLWHYNLAENEG